MADNCELHSGRLNNVRGYNLTVTGNDGRHETVTSEVRLTFDKFSEAAVEQTVILRLETAQSGQASTTIRTSSPSPPTWTSLRRSTTGSWCSGLTMVTVYINVKDNSPTFS